MGGRKRLRKNLKWEGRESEIGGEMDSWRQILFHSQNLPVPSRLGIKLSCRARVLVEMVNPLLHILHLTGDSGLFLYPPVLTTSPYLVYFFLKCFPMKWWPTTSRIYSSGLAYWTWFGSLGIYLKLKLRLRDLESWFETRNLGDSMVLDSRFWMLGS